MWADADLSCTRKETPECKKRAIARPSMRHFALLSLAWAGPHFGPGLPALDVGSFISTMCIAATCILVMLSEIALCQNAQETSPRVSSSQASCLSGFFSMPHECSRSLHVKRPSKMADFACPCPGRHASFLNALAGSSWSTSPCHRRSQVLQYPVHCCNLHLRSAFIDGFASER